LNWFISGQSVLSARDEDGIQDMIGSGVTYRATDQLDISGEYFSDGASDGARVGVGYRFRDNSKAYLNYVTERGASSREGITLGQKTEINNRLNVYSEHRFDRSARDNVQGESYGIEYDFTDNWALEGDVLFGTTERRGVKRERTAYSISSRLRNTSGRLVNRLEYRIDESNDGDAVDQWVTTNRWDVRVNDAWVWVGKADFAYTDYRDASTDAAKFGEFDLGMAYRPVTHNRLNLLAMTSYVYDMDPQNQNGGLYADEKGIVYSIEGIYQLTDRFKLGGKLAHKRSSVRLDRDADDFIDATTNLRIMRMRYHLLWRLDALLEYRWLDVREIGDQKEGGLLGVDVQFGPNLSIGVGYNFTEFNDRLTILDYDSEGWFVNLSGQL